ncbi:unnamed protein product [Eretmochelys imbricata]
MTPSIRTEESCPLKKLPDLGELLEGQGEIKLPFCEKGEEQTKSGFRKRRFIPSSKCYTLNTDLGSRCLFLSRGSNSNMVVRKQFTKKLVVLVQQLSLAMNTFDSCHNGALILLGTDPSMRDFSAAI